MNQLKIIQRAATLLCTVATEIEKVSPTQKPAVFDQIPSQELNRLEKGATSKGQLLFRAVPWGRISIDGGKEMEGPVLKKLPYGRHEVKASYLGPDQEWHMVQRTVTVQKPETVCTAEFRPDGFGKIVCR